MVVVQGAEVKSAKNSKILYSLFEQGSKSRHTASTSRLKTRPFASVCKIKACQNVSGSR